MSQSRTTQIFTLWMVFASIAVASFFPTHSYSQSFMGPRALCVTLFNSSTTSLLNLPQSQTAAPKLPSGIDEIPQAILAKILKLEGSRAGKILEAFEKFSLEERAVFIEMMRRTPGERVCKI